VLLLAVGDVSSRVVSRPSCGAMVEDGLRSFSSMSWFRVKESVCMSRVKRTCSGREVCLRARFECFFRRKNRARRRRTETTANEPRAMPIFAPVESPEVCLLAVATGAAVELGVCVAVITDMLVVGELELEAGVGALIKLVVVVTR